MVVVVVVVFGGIRGGGGGVGGSRSGAGGVGDSRGGVGGSEVVVVLEVEMVLHQLWWCWTSGLTVLCQCLYTSGVVFGWCSGGALGPPASAEPMG